MPHTTKFTPAELESAGKSEPNYTGEFIFREWCGNSYEWDALADVERQRWNRLAARKSSLLADALAALRNAPKDNDPGALRTNYCRWLDEVRDPLLARAEEGRSE